MTPEIKRYGSGERQGIFCLEGEWSEDLQNRFTVRPLLEVLEGLEKADVFHRNIATKCQLEFYIDAWQRPQFECFDVLYLPMHGSEGAISLGGSSLTLDELGELLKGKCKGCVIYFGTCLTMKAAEQDLMRFVSLTGARAVIGYRRAVPFDTVAAFELPLLQELTTRFQGRAVYNHLVKDHPVLTKKLGLVVATRQGVL